MKDTRAGGGGAFSCNPMSINELEPAVVRFHIEPGFFAGEKSPLQAREVTDSPNPYLAHPIWLT
jgi:hypothetical protein